MKIVRFYLIFPAERINCSQTVGFLQRDLQLHETGAKNSTLILGFKQIYSAEFYRFLIFPVTPPTSV